MTPVSDWSEVPEFATEKEEHDFWSCHSLGESLLNQMKRYKALKELAEQAQELDMGY